MWIEKIPRGLRLWNPTLAQKVEQGGGTRQFLEFMAILGVISVVVNVAAFTESFEARNVYQFVAKHKEVFLATLERTNPNLH
jgi:hypothetical protein